MPPGAPRIARAKRSGTRKSREAAGSRRRRARARALLGAPAREPEAQLYCAPGNPGTAELASNLPIPADDLDRMADAADMHGDRSHDHRP